MPIHDWSNVEAGIFHHFHHSWIEEIQRALNAGLLPPEYYAMAEQHTGAFGPDVLTLQAGDASSEADGGGSLLLAPPEVELTAETDMEFYRRKQNTVTVRHVTGDRIVSVIEIVSCGNKSSNVAMRAFLDKAAELLFQGVHLLVVDLHAPGPRDPHGIHGAIWDDITSEVYRKPDKPLTLASYESGPAGSSTRAYVRPVSMGDLLPDMPLFLEPGGHVLVPLEATYEQAFAALPARWRRVLEA